MTDRVVSLTVVLDAAYRIDDAQEIMDAIQMLKGVVAVKANVANAEYWTAQASALYDLRAKIWAVLQED